MPVNKPDKSASQITSKADSTSNNKNETIKKSGKRPAEQKKIGGEKKIKIDQKDSLEKKVSGISEQEFRSFVKGVDKTSRWYSMEHPRREALSDTERKKTYELLIKSKDKL